MMHTQKTLKKNPSLNRLKIKAEKSENALLSNVQIENPIINFPYEEPKHHFRFSDDGITNEIINDRRASSYFVPIAKPKKKGSKNFFVGLHVIRAVLRLLWHEHD